MELRLLDTAALGTVYHVHLKADFPPDERKPLFAMERLRAAGRYDPLGLYEGETLLGYACVWRDEAMDYAMLDYFAVCRGGRGRGTGTALLAMLKERYRDWRGLLAEAEALEARASAQENALRLRRLAFYRRAGFALVGCRAHLFHVWYELLATGPADAQAVRAAHLRLYGGEGPAGIRRLVRIRYQPYEPGETPGVIE